MLQNRGQEDWVGTGLIPLASICGSVWTIDQGMDVLTFLKLCNKSIVMSAVAPQICSACYSSAVCIIVCILLYSASVCGITISLSVGKVLGLVCWVVLVTAPRVVIGTARRRHRQQFHIKFVIRRLWLAATTDFCRRSTCRTKSALPAMYDDILLLC